MEIPFQRILRASSGMLLALLIPIFSFSQNVKPLFGANSPQDDLNPVWIGNNTLLFTRAFHPENIGGINDPGDIWMTQRSSNGDWQAAVHRPDLSRIGFDLVLGLENPLTLLVYHQEESTAGFYQYSKFGTDWNFLRKVNMPGIEGIKGQISGRVTSSGKQIFISGIGRDSKGNEDLYLSVKLDAIEWSAPMNLGETLNTLGQEMSPFFDAGSSNLFFSSNMHSGANGKDIFISKQLTDDFKTWSKPIKWEQISSNGSDISVTFISPSEVIWTSAQNSDGFADLLTFEKNIKLEIPTEFDLPVLDSTRNKDENRGSATSNSGMQIEPIYPLSAVGIPEIKLVDSSIEAEKPISWLVIDAKNKIEVPFKLSWVTLNKSFQADGNSIVKLSQLLESNVAELTVLAKGYFPTLIPVENLNSKAPNVVLMTKAESGNSVVLKNVNFKRGTAELEGAETIRSLTEIAEFLLENPELRLRIHGHTDNAGDPGLNKGLSLDRASSVRAFLIAKGVPFESLRISGWGGIRPIASNATEAGRSKNRRVELTVEQ